MPGSRSSRRDLLIWLAGVAPAILLLLHATAIAPLGWERRSLNGLEAMGGHMYGVSLGSRWMSQEITGDSPAQLLEDGSPLPSANADLDQIVKKGAGRYALKFGYLHLSASDNGDPRANGRRYELILPAQPSFGLMGAVFLVAVGATLWLLMRYREAIVAVLRAPPFWLSATVFLAIVFLGRAWYFLEFRVPGLYGDSTSYYALTQVMNAGRWPEFGIRMPGYPVFIWAIQAVSNTVAAVIVVQNLMTVAACLTLIYAFHAYRRSLSMWASLGMATYAVGLWVFENDTALISDSPYGSCLVFATACLMLGLVRNRATFFVLSSSAMALAILFRPAGMFLFVIYALCLAFLLRNRFGTRSLVAFATPLPAVMLALCCYNYATIHVFAMTAFGESQIGFATFTFWEQDPSYPPNVNDAIARTQAVMRKQVSEQGRELIRSSWDFEKLSQVFVGGFHYPALDQASTINGTNDYMAARKWVQKIAFDSIAKHPDTYLKFVLTQLWLQYINNPRYQEDFISFVRNRISDIYTGDRYTPGKGQPFYVEMAKEWAARPAMPGFKVVGDGEDAEFIVKQSSVLRRLNRYVVFVRRILFANIVPTWVYFLATVVSAVALLRSGYRDTGAFIAFIITISFFGASLVVALVEYGAYRYSAVMEFAYYVPVLALVFLRPDQPPERHV